MYYARSSRKTHTNTHTHTHKPNTAQWRRQNFVTGGEVRYGSIGGLEYEVPQKLTHLLQCIGNL